MTRLFEVVYVLGSLANKKIKPSKALWQLKRSLGWFYHYIINYLYTACRTSSSSFTLSSSGN
jgi:hypothetical protein